MKRFKLLILLLTLMLVAAFALTGCGKQTTSKVRLWEVTHSIFYAPMYVAIHEGYFEDEGIEIELFNAGGADKVMTGVLAGQADIGFCGPEATIYVYNEGREDHPIVFAQLTQKDGSFLVGRNPEPDFKWESLAGKTIIGGRKGGVPAMALEYVLRQHGLVPNKDLEFLTNIQFDLMAGAFKGGTGDYVALFEPVAATLEKEGSGYVVASIGAAAGELPYTAYMAKKSYIEKNSDIIQRFTNALYKGQLWVQNNKAEDIAREIKSFFPDADDDILVTVINRYKEIDAWNNTPISIPESFELLQDVMETAGELDKRVDHSVLFDDRFAEEAVKNIK
ncbi:MAG TPA: ABC transporter substrate-binding protein [Candidatus Atribacteria bacterium]|nr:ABC transporter substrate-binding protein [Candidatus Atribacteria bacterium]